MSNATNKPSENKNNQSKINTINSEHFYSTYS